MYVGFEGMLEHFCIYVRMYVHVHTLHVYMNQLVEFHAMYLKCDIVHCQISCMYV